MTVHEQTRRDKIIINVFGGIGIVGGILARRASGLNGMIPGAIFGMAGAVIGAVVGGIIISLLPKADVSSDNSEE